MADALPPLAFPANGEEAFHRALHRAARVYLGDDHRCADRWRVFSAALLAFSSAGCYLASLMQKDTWAFAGGYLLCVLLVMLLNIVAFHDAAHNAFLRSSRANRLVSRLITLPLGIDPDYWRVRHARFHHGYANVEGYDLDIEENGIFRQTPFQRWRPHMRYQHLYWPLIAALSLPYIAWVFDWSDRLGKTPLRDRGVLPGLKGWAVFVLGKIGHLVVMLWLPLAVAHHTGIGAGTVLLAYLFSQMLASLWVVFLLLGTHWADAEFYQAPDAPLMPHGWYRHNFATACDWQPSPQWLHHWVGGLNFHLTHHLFPGWSHRHYPALAGIIARLAEEHGMAYRCLGYRELLRQQQVFLRRMGRAPR